jgi:hypothetical protein
MIERQGLEERQQKWKKAQDNVLELLVGNVSPPYNLSNIPGYQGDFTEARGHRSTNSWGMVIDYLCHPLEQRPLAVWAINLAAQEISAHYIRVTEGQSDSRICEIAGHEIVKVGLLCGFGFCATHKTSFLEEFRDGRISPLSRGLLDLHIKHAEILEPHFSLEAIHRMMGNYELAQNEVERIGDMRTGDLVKKYVGIDPEEVHRFNERGNRAVLPILTSFRREYSSQLINPALLKQEVLGLVLNVQKLWFPRGN